MRRTISEGDNKKKQFEMSLALIISISFLVPFPAGIGTALAQDKSTNIATIKLPAPKYSSDTPVEKALLERRSVRSYKAEPLTIPEIAQFLWAAPAHVSHVYG
jgi:hypothetical protein